MKNILLVVGNANDIFVYNFAKWIKKSMDANIDVFEFNHSDAQAYGDEYYDNVTTANHDNILCKLPKVRAIFSSYVASKSLDIYLRDKHYDIIQCHWVLPAFVESAKSVRQHCDKLYVCFWGGEFDVQKIFMSKALYLKRLEKMLCSVDGIIGSPQAHSKVLRYFPTLKCNMYNGTLGSSPLEALYTIMNSIDKIQSKKKIGLNPQKISILLGYSGKSLHQHLDIIDAFIKHKDLIDEVQLFAPMTRGASKEYIVEIEEKLKASGYDYLVLKDRFLTDEEMGYLRLATDITMQLSTFDGYSRSIQECLCAKSVVIYGEWLGYGSRFEDDGFTAYKVSSIEQGVVLANKVASNLDVYADVVEKNSKNGKNKNLWSECIKNWVRIYES